MVTPFPLPEGLPRDPPHGDETPVAVQEVVIHLLAVMQQQERSGCARSRPRLAALEARGLRNSGHSDRPPSSDSPWGETDNSPRAEGPPRSQARAPGASPSPVGADCGHRGPAPGLWLWADRVSRRSA